MPLRPHCLGVLLCNREREARIFGIATGARMVVAWGMACSVTGDCFLGSACQLAQQACCSVPRGRQKNSSTVTLMMAAKKHHTEMNHIA